MSKLPDFYLSSTEGYDLNEPRKCWLLSRHSYGDRNDFAYIKVSPSIIYTDEEGKQRQLTRILIAARHIGFSVFEKKTWPVCVYVLKLNIEEPEEALNKEDFINIAWAEIYQTEKEAIEKS